MIIGEEAVIGEIIMQKGMAAAGLIDTHLCSSVDAKCCPGTTLKLGYAAKLLNKETTLSELIEKLNGLPDVK